MIIFLISENTDHFNRFININCRSIIDSIIYLIKKCYFDVNFYSILYHSNSNIFDNMNYNTIVMIITTLMLIRKHFDELIFI